ncbi:M60 family metallopeptidase [Curtobacterium sp. SP.BCo]|uniref:M60 family metallopeptidase n=1 Tax=Curtobacterium sp. SP.BCo TaxID=3435229 RepID=UPI003F740340
MRSFTIIPIAACTIAASLLVPLDLQPATAHAAASAAPDSNRAAQITVDVPAMPVGVTSDWIRVQHSGLFQGVLTVTAPAGTRIVAADADIRPMAGSIAAGGATATWSGATTTWDSKWRVAKFRLVADADAPLGTRDGGRAVIADGSGAELASGSFAVHAAAALTATPPPIAIGQTSDWIQIAPSHTVRGELTVTAPNGTTIVAADADVRPAPASISADGKSAHWSDPTMTWAADWRVPKFKLKAVSSAVGNHSKGSMTVVDGTGPDPQAIGSYQFVARGALPTSIVDSADRSSTEVLVHGMGRADTEQAREHRSMRHSDLQPTGRFVRVGDVLEVAVPSGAPAVGVRIGLYGDAHQGVNTSGWQALTATPAGRTTSITATKDGMVFLESTAPRGSATVRVTGGQSVPTFVMGQTSDADFTAQLADMPNAPIFEVVGNRIFGDFQSRTRGHVPSGITERVQLWDDIVELTNDMHNLHDDATGAARKSPHRMYIASPDTGSGYANASHERIMFQVSTGAARDVFAEVPGEVWGLFHEIGHTYQTPSYNWSGQGEVAVNVSSLYVEKRLGLKSSLDTPSDLNKLRSWFSKPVEERQYGSADIWVRLTMYDQLRRAFGDEFYPRLNQELRTGLLFGDNTATTTAEQQNHFALTAGRIADRDLSEFFRQWGIPLTDASKAELSKLPELSVPIWENIDPKQTRVEHELPSVGTPSGTVRTDETVVVGQRRLQRAPEVSGLSSPDGGNVTIGGHAVTALDPGTGTVNVEARDSRGLREALQTSVPVSAGNSVKILGQSDRTVMWLSLVPGSKELRVVPRTTYKAHTSWAGKEYVSLELRSADDAESLGKWSIRGDETAHALGARFDEHYEDGQIIVVRHQQNSGMVGYTDGTQMSASSERDQRFRITGDRLVRLGPIAPLPGADTTLRPGTTTEVTAGLEFHADTTGASGAVTFTAPKGTTFDSAIGKELLGNYRPAGGSWSTATGYARLSDVVRSADGSELHAKYTFTQDSVRGYDRGDQLRWRLPLTVPTDAPAGDGSLDFAFTGTSNAGAIDIAGSTATSIKTNNGNVSGDGLGFPTDVEHGATGEVVVGLRTTGEVTAFEDTSFRVTAPEGTTFSDATGTVPVEYQHAGDEGWTTTKSNETALSVSDDGRTATVTFATTAGFKLHDGSGLRIRVPITGVTAEASGTAHFEVTGTTDRGRFTASGDSTVTVGPAAPVTDLVVTSPAQDSVVYSDRPVFSGTGHEGATITIRGTVRVVATTTVRDGKWSVPAAFDLGANSYALRVTQTAGGEPQHRDILFRTAPGATADLVVTSPLQDSVVNAKRPVFTGTGHEGATITIRGTARVVATTTVVDGTWSVPADFDLGNGAYALTVHQTHGSSQPKKQDVRFTVR